MFDSLAGKLLANDPLILAIAAERLAHERLDLNCRLLGATDAEIARYDLVWLREWLKMGRPAWGLGLTVEQMWWAYRLQPAITTWFENMTAWLAALDIPTLQSRKPRPPRRSKRRARK